MAENTRPHLGDCLMCCEQIKRLRPIQGRKQRTMFFVVLFVFFIFLSVPSLICKATAWHIRNLYAQLTTGRLIFPPSASPPPIPPSPNSPFALKPSDWRSVYEASSCVDTSAENDSKAVVLNTLCGVDRPLLVKLVKQRVISSRATLLLFQLPCTWISRGLSY